MGWRRLLLFWVQTCSVRRHVTAITHDQRPPTTRPEPLTSLAIGISSSSRLPSLRLLRLACGTANSRGAPVPGDAVFPSLARIAATPPPSAIWASISSPVAEQNCVFSPGDTDRTGMLLVDGASVVPVAMEEAVAVGW